MLDRLFSLTGCHASRLREHLAKRLLSAGAFTPPPALYFFQGIAMIGVSRTRRPARCEPAQIGGTSMLLKPPVSQHAALEWLKARFVEAYGVEITPAIENDLGRLAESMARISAVELPVEVEPLLA